MLTLIMAKKHKTRQEKIIAQLRRQINLQTKVSQEAVSPVPPQINRPTPVNVYPETSNFSPYSHLIKKDLLKTLIITLAVFSLELVLYWKLR